MHKADSFLKECQRLYPFSPRKDIFCTCSVFVLSPTVFIVTVGLRRLALKDFTFSDGTFIPKGTHVAAAQYCIQRDPEIHEDAGSFNPWRFSDAREKDTDPNSTKHAFVSTGLDYLTFGHGRHAW